MGTPESVVKSGLRSAGGDGVGGVAGDGAFGLASELLIFFARGGKRDGKENENGGDDYG